LHRIKREMYRPLWVLAGLILGIAAGLLLQQTPHIVTEWIKPMGTLFLKFIKMIVIPLEIFSIVAGVSGMESVTALGKLGRKVIVFYLATTVLAACIGILSADLVDVSHTALTPAAAVAADPVTVAIPNFWEAILGLVPDNPIAAMASGNLIQVVIFSLCLGGGILMLGDHKERLAEFFHDGFLALQNVVTAIMRFAPVGVFALMTAAVAETGTATLEPLLRLAAGVFLGCLIHIVLVYVPVILACQVKIPTFLRAMAEAMMVATTTGSSSATIPFTSHGLKLLGVSHSIRGFVLPLGATINMDGTAIFQSVSAVFVAGLYGLELDLLQQIVVVLVVTVASVGTAGIPAAGTVMLGMVLQSIGLPLEGIALVMGIEVVLDMGRSLVNTLGDAVCALAVSGHDRGPVDPRLKSRAGWRGPHFLE